MIVITTKKKSLVICWAQQVFFSSEFAPLHPHLSVDQKSDDEKILIRFNFYPQNRYGRTPV
jgi:hypothetical protein